jgi:hypothetical protein
MAHAVEAILGVDESCAQFLITGKCDILVEGLTSGAVQLQYKLPKSTVKTAPAWTAWPGTGGTFTADAYKTVFLSEHGVLCRLTGVSNNNGVYVRIGRYNNT